MFVDADESAGDLNLVCWHPLQPIGLSVGAFDICRFFTPRDCGFFLFPEGKGEFVDDDVPCGKGGI